jgi:hypothetical protein
MCAVFGGLVPPLPGVAWSILSARRRDKFPLSHRQGKQRQNQSQGHLLAREFGINNATLIKPPRILLYFYDTHFEFQRATMMASAAPLRKYQTELRDTGYISREALKAKLVEIFGQMNFKISVCQIFITEDSR